MKSLRLTLLAGLPLLALAACGDGNRDAVDTGDDAQVAIRGDVPAPQENTRPRIGYPDAEYLLTPDHMDTLRPINGASAQAEGEVIVMSGGPGTDSGTANGRVDGVVLWLPESIENDASGRRVEITIRARGVSSSRLAMSYSTNEVGASGWQEFSLTDEFQDITFIYPVSPMRAGGGDYLGILPDASGDGGTIEVQWLSVDTIDRP